MISRCSQQSVRTLPLPSCQIAMTTPPQVPRCSGESVVFFQPRFQWTSLSPDCALYLPVEFTGHYRSSDKMKPRTSGQRFLNSSHTLISYAVFCLRDESVTGVQ